jgi:hypothetical protein
MSLHVLGTRAKWVRRVALNVTNKESRTADKRCFNLRVDEILSSSNITRKLRNEELHDLYSSPNIVRVIKSRRMRWAGHVARKGSREVCIGFWYGNLREINDWGDPGVDGRIILGWIFRKWGVRVWTGLGWLRI